MANFLLLKDKEIARLNISVTFSAGLTLLATKVMAWGSHQKKKKKKKK